MQPLKCCYDKGTAEQWTGGHWAPYSSKWYQDSLPSTGIHSLLNPSPPPPPRPFLFTSNSLFLYLSPLLSLPSPISLLLYLSPPQLLYSFISLLTPPASISVYYPKVLNPYFFSYPFYFLTPYYIPLVLYLLPYHLVHSCTHSLTNLLVYHLIVATESWCSRR